jgi:hypothetical protein
VVGAMVGACSAHVRISDLLLAEPHPEIVTERAFGRHNAKSLDGEMPFGSWEDLGTSFKRDLNLGEQPREARRSSASNVTMRRQRD